MTRIRYHLIALLVVAIAAGSAAGAAVTKPGSADGAIVFARGSDLYVRSTAGTVRRLTSTRAQEALPAWSPDRRELAYVRSGNIWVMRADGTRARRLGGGTSPASDLYPAWSPDGRLIAFASTRAGGEHELYVMRRDGTKVRRLTRTARWMDDIQPRFSPDGQFIVFAANRPSHFNYELYRIRLRDGGGLTRLTFWGSGEDGAPGDDGAPVYSPYGGMLAFTSDRSGDTSVWTMSADGRFLREVARHPGAHAMFPRFSPDGGSLVYTVSTDRRDGTADSRVWTVRLNGTARTEVGPGGEADWGTGNFLITPHSIGGAALGLAGSEYARAVAGTSRLDRLGDGLTRLVFPGRGLDVYVSRGKGVALLTWERTFRTAESVGPCSPAVALRHAYGSSLRQIPTTGPVSLYRLDSLVFRVVDERVAAVAVGRGELAAQAAGNSLDCGAR